METATVNTTTTTNTTQEVVASTHNKEELAAVVSQILDNTETITATNISDDSNNANTTENIKEPQKPKKDLRKRLKNRINEKELDELFANGSLTDDPHPADKLLRKRLPSLRSIEVQIPFYDTKRNHAKSKSFSQLLADELVMMYQSHYLSYAWLSHLAKQVSLQEVNHIHASTFWESYSTLFDQDINSSVERLSASEIRFIEHFQREINKVNKFSTSKINELENILADCIQRIMATKAELSTDQLRALEGEVNSVAQQVVLMGKFVRQNKIGFHNIVKKYEKQIGAPAAWLLIYLEKEPFWNLPLDHLIVAMSEIYRKIRAIEARTGSVAELKAFSVQTFQRKCFKFWVRPEDVPAVKALIIQHLPIQIFDKKPNFSTADSIPRDLSDSSVISSIYFDNDKYDIYYGRLIRGEKRGNLIRVRWYGPHENPTTDVWMERKTHKALKEGSTEQEAVKERFRLKAKYVDGYLKGDNTVLKKLNKAIKQKRVSAEEGAKQVQMATEIQEEIVSKGLRPALRTVYRRTAFQLGSNQSHRISIDSNLHIIEEPAGQINWYRDYQELLQLSEVMLFPYAILEVKLQEDPAPWVDKLLGSGLLIPAYKFSKFNHGIAEFYTNKVTQMPHWYNVYHKKNNFPVFSQGGVSIHKSRRNSIGAAVPPAKIVKRVSFSADQLAVEQHHIIAGAVETQGDEPQSSVAHASHKKGMMMKGPHSALQSIATSISAMLNDKDKEKKKNKGKGKDKKKEDGYEMTPATFTAATLTETTVMAPKPIEEVAIDMYEPGDDKKDNKMKGDETRGSSNYNGGGVSNSDNNNSGVFSDDDNPPSPTESDLDLEIERLKRKLRKKEKKKRKVAEARKRQQELQRQQAQSVDENGVSVGGSGGGSGEPSGNSNRGNNNDGLMELHPFPGSDGQPEGKRKKKGGDDDSDDDGPESHKKSKKGSRRDPKVYLANERTLLSWLNMITFIAVAAISLLTLGSNLTQIAGLILMPLCIIYSFYSLFRYHIRRKGIIQGVMRGIDDYVGPYTFVVFLCIVLIMVTAFSFAYTGNVEGYKEYAQAWPNN